MSSCTSPLEKTYKISNLENDAIALKKVLTEDDFNILTEYIASKSLNENHIFGETYTDLLVEAKKMREEMKIKEQEEKRLAEKRKKEEEEKARKDHQDAIAKAKEFERQQEERRATQARQQKVWKHSDLSFTMQYFNTYVATSREVTYTNSRIIVGINTRNGGNVYLETMSGERNTYELTNPLEVSESDGVRKIYVYNSNGQKGYIEYEQDLVVIVFKGKTIVSSKTRENKSDVKLLHDLKQMNI